MDLEIKLIILLLSIYKNDNSDTKTKLKICTNIGNSNYLILINLKIITKHIIISFNFVFFKLILVAIFFIT